MSVVAATGSSDATADHPAAPGIRVDLSVLGEMMGHVAPDLAELRPILGRDRELAHLAEHVGLAGDSTPQAGRAVLLAGDAGVGKTRLLAELIDRADRAGWRTTVGHCLDFGDSALPYLPFSELFGRLARHDPDLGQRLAQRNPALNHLQPGRRLLSGAALSPDDGIDRAELFDSVHGALDQLAEDGPLLVVVEDAHWADRSTRDLLTFLFTRPFRSPVAVVASYRSDDLHRRHPLRTSVAEWVRLPGVHRLQLPPLADADVRRLVQSLPGGDLAPGDLRAIVSRAEGNAFFAEELVNAELGARGLPGDLADLLLVRLDRLEEDSRRAVRAAAVAGRRVPHESLSAVSDLAPDALDRALRAAVDSHVLVRVGDDSYAFRHALLAEAVYDDLLPGERVRMHAAYAEAIGSQRVDGTAAELARHARAAHDLDTAVLASIDAGDDAMSVGGPDEAAQHYETALELLADPRRERPDGLDQAGLVARTAEAVIASGHPERARKIVRDQLRRLSDDAPDEERARLLMALAGASLLTESWELALDATTEALTLVPDEPTTLRAKLLAVHARAHLDHAHEDDAARFATEALALAQKLDMPRLIADAATTLAGVDQQGGDADTAIHALGRVVDQARRDHDSHAEMRGLWLLGGMHHERACLPEALQAFHLAVEAGEQAGTPWAPYASDSRLLEALTAYEAGDWDRALEVADRAGRLGPPVAEALLDAVRIVVAAGRGEARAVRLLLDKVRPLWERDGMLAITTAAAGIDAYGDAGDMAGGITVHDEAVATIGRIWNPHFQARVRITAVLLGQLASAAGRVPRAERSALAARVPELLAAVEGVQQRLAKRRRPFGPEGRAWLARVDAEQLRLRWLAGVDPPEEKQLLDAWQLSVDAFEEMGHAFELARSRARLGVVLRAAGRPDDAATVLRAAGQAASRLGAAPLLAELGEIPSAARSRGARTTDLTARESEILTLVAAGRSNGEIARQLFISVKTVSVHVSNILAKLGAAGRTEAAAIARRDGLIDAP